MKKSTIGHAMMENLVESEFFGDDFSVNTVMVAGKYRIESIELTRSLFYFR